MNNVTKIISFITIIGMIGLISPQSWAEEYPTLHKTVEVNGVEIFYREAGPKDAPTILLLHGYPTSSHMFRNLMRDLSDQFHLVAPDYPGFGNSEQPPMAEFDYSFDNMANIIDGFLAK